MSNVLYLAWRYLAYHRIKTAILIASITLIIYLPVGLRILVDRSAEELTARAVATPLVVGSKGSQLELVLNTLYFRADYPEIMSYGEAIQVAETGLATAIPMYVRFRARSVPIVATTLDYFGFRRMEIASGRFLATLGECVVGARAAEELGVGPGDSIISSPENVFDIAGVYPLKMNVTGVLASSGTADDEAIFVDLKTGWIIAGFGHGHQDLAQPGAASAVLSRDEGRITANASVVEYNEITPENVGSFHFHGDPSGYPITAVVAVPHDEKAKTLLLGRYEAGQGGSQAVRPEGVMDELLDTIFRVRQYVVAAVIVIGISTLATAALVFMLSLRLRRREIETMVKIGGAKTRIASVLVSEVVLVLLISATLATVLTIVSDRYGAALIRELIL